MDTDFAVGGYHVLAVAPGSGGYDNSWYGQARLDPRTLRGRGGGGIKAKPYSLLTHRPFPSTVWYSGSNNWV